jgi:hypothetical protein|tara:strand:+ start:3507 stop:3704 length:198 start_codon:yes stop_codon:yes gene_type:complete
MYSLEKRKYNKEILTRDEYRKFGLYMNEHYPNVGHIVEALDDTFIVHLHDTPLTFWEEILTTIRD